MSISNLQNNGISIKDLQGFNKESLGGSNLLDSLGERVSQTLALKEAQQADSQLSISGAGQKEILDGIAELSMKHFQAPIAGMQLSNLV